LVLVGGHCLSLSRLAGVWRIGSGSLGFSFGLMPGERLKLAFDALDPLTYPSEHAPNYTARFAKKKARPGAEHAS